jgi:hypothetical protein
MSNQYLEYLYKEAAGGGVGGMLMTGAKAAWGGIRADAAKLPSQFKTVATGLSPKAQLAKRTKMLPSNEVRMSGMKDMVKNKALLTGAAGVVGAKALMSPRREPSPY